MGNTVIEKDQILRLMHMHVDEVRQGYAKVSMPLVDGVKNGMGVAHGGTIFSLADIAFGVAANEDSENFVVTLTTSIEFLRPGKVSPLVAEAFVTRQGRHIQNYEVKVYDGSGALIAKTIAQGYTTHTKVENSNPTEQLGAWERKPANVFGFGQPNVPSGFDVNEFLQGAKAVYLRMQASWDQRDLDDIALFATDTVMNVLREQMRQDPSSSHTEILNMNLQLMQTEADGLVQRAKVFFDVLMRENQYQQPEQVKEIWQFVRTLPDGTWRLDGIQQVG